MKMSIISMVMDFIGTPTSYAGELILYSLAAILLLVVIEGLFKIFHAIIKIFH